MKRRVLTVAIAAMMVMPMCGQMRSGTLRAEQTIDLSGTSGLESIRMRPDTVMPSGDWQRVVESQMPAKECFKYARQVLACIVPDYQRNVQLEDTADCKIIVSACMPLLASKKSERGEILFRGTYRVTLTLVMKDGRYRVSSEGAKCSYDVRMSGQVIDHVSDRAFDMANRLADGSMQTDMSLLAGRLAYLIDSRMKKQKADDDF